MWCAISLALLLAPQESVPPEAGFIPVPAHVRLPRNFEFDDHGDYGIALGAWMGRLASPELAPPRYG